MTPRNRWTIREDDPDHQTDDQDVPQQGRHELVRVASTL
jgi:hypothetical protein